MFLLARRKKRSPVTALTAWPKESYFICSIETCEWGVAVLSWAFNLPNLHLSTCAQFPAIFAKRQWSHQGKRRCSETNKRLKHCLRLDPSLVFRSDTRWMLWTYYTITCVGVHLTWPNPEKKQSNKTFLKHLAVLPCSESAVNRMHSFRLLHVQNMVSTCPTVWSCAVDCLLR